MDFLMELNDSYAQTRTQLLLMEPIPSISRAFSLLLQEKQQRATGSFYPAINTPAIALAVHGYPRGYKTKQQRINNSNSGSISSNITNSVTTQTSNASTNFNSVTNPTEALLQCQNLLNQLQSQLTAPSNNSTNHIADIKPCSASISLPNKNTYQVKNIGTVKLSDTLILKDVHYMPDFTFNLLSNPIQVTTMEIPIPETKQHRP
ncbi:Integrase, catalytic core [Cucumis melo var. makuwa]|uniref:Integrase, catalytic core n=1 Tax=Cucumis melo var. makuwa TaxID=1194695 RepID=A0A5D3DVU7_CUCMM|nr:Integrase, catalytic core [Cucumis melo var. makuwa]TYK27624.1 Integrase, catalytic core [Cucumis melo var. makuwa]